MHRSSAAVVLIILASLAFANRATAQDDYLESLKVWPKGVFSSDQRLGAAKTLDDHFPMIVPDNAGDWHVRREQLRTRVLVATGLWPMPERTPIEPTIYGKIQRDGFTIEKVFFESLPGHFVTGLLFRPDPDGKLESVSYPGVLCPHGHGGRNQAYTDEELNYQIEIGAEHFADSGRMPKLARCATLARMGCVSFIFDMVGYDGSTQIPYEVAHRHAKSRAAESVREPGQWILFSIEADLRLQSIMGLQAWNLLRAFDVLASLPDVDEDRLAVTGGSGGGTQSILLGAIDDRVKVSFPNGMVSTSMQGGCYCENCNYLRVGTGNVELAALMAPKPMAMTAADDWTKDMMTDGYPELRYLYTMIGNEDDVYCRPMLNFKHNYNYIARATMYQWMNRHLKLGLAEPVIEQDFVSLTPPDLEIWDADHPAPQQTGIKHEREVCQWFDEQAKQSLESLSESDRRIVLEKAWSTIFDVRMPNEVNYEKLEASLGSLANGGIQVERGVFRVPATKNEIPVLTLRPEKTTGEPSTDRVVIWTHETGKVDALKQADSRSRILAAVRTGATVLVPDVLGQGELTRDGEPWSKQRLVDDDRDYSALTFAYNRPLVVERAADVLALISHAIQDRRNDDSQIILVSSGDAIAWAAGAAAIAGGQLNDFQIHNADFEFDQVAHYSDPLFVPGAMKYGGINGLIELRSPHKTTRLGD